MINTQQESPSLRFAITARYIMVAAIAAALCAITPSAHAQQATQHAAPATATPAAAKPAVAEEEPSTTPKKPGGEGIKIHGHWVLQVKNADGTLGERREFDNSLTKVGSEISGDQLLGMLISGNAVTGDPAVAFSNATTAPADPGTICLNTDGKIAAGTAVCGAITTATSFFAPTGSLYLASGSTTQTGLTMLLTVYPTVSWVLSGTYTVVPGQTTIGTVQTLIGVCYPGILTAGDNGTIDTGNSNEFQGTSPSREALSAPSTCDQTHDVYNANFEVRIGTLTSTLVGPSPLTVSPGQLIQVTVTISFS